MRSQNKYYKITVIIPLALACCIAVTMFPKQAVASTTAYAVIDVNTGIVLAECLGDERKPMASTTKIMTAVIALENIDNLDERYAVPKAAVGVEGSSVYLKAGEPVSVRELLYCLMLRSGNDAAVAIAIITAGSVKNFASLMNAKAQELGLSDTHFVNTHGLHDDNHYTTATELAQISAYAMKNPTFREIVSAKCYVGERGTYRNKNKLLFDFLGANGIKTGYTKNAGRCLVSSAERDGNTVVCVVLDCPTTYETSKKLLDEAFSSHNFMKVWSKEDEKGLPINGIPRLSCLVGTQEDVIVPVKKGLEEHVRIELNLPKNLDFPVKKGTEIGQISVLCQNDLLFSQKIYTIEDVGKNKLIFT